MAALIERSVVKNMKIFLKQDPTPNCLFEWIRRKKIYKKTKGNRQYPQLAWWKTIS